MSATIGRLVHYQLSESDAALINRQREDYRKALLGGIPPMQDGRINHVGNGVAEGSIYPAIVVAAWGTGEHVNLQVFLDGSDTYWAGSRAEGEGPGFWAWPVRS